VIENLAVIAEPQGSRRIGHGLLAG
jgi:hypothetical protein